MSAIKLLGAVVVTSLLSTVAAGCAAETTTDEDVSESGGRLLAGRRLSPSEVARHLRNAGFADEDIGTMVCAAKYESAFYDRASNKNSNGTLDRGLFQINSIHLGRKGCPSRGDSLWDTSANAKCALSVFEGQGFRAWNGYKKHKSECDRYPDPSRPRSTSSSSSSGSTDDPSDNASSSGSSTSSGSSSGSSSEAPAGGTEGPCWSTTLQDIVEARTCVQSKGSGVWFQCMEGEWHRGGNATSGPYGPCVGSHPL